jgi:hypothetical protein
LSALLFKLQVCLLQLLLSLDGEIQSATNPNCDVVVEVGNWKMTPVPSYRTDRMLLDYCCVSPSLPAKKISKNSNKMKAILSEEEEEE